MTFAYKTDIKRLDQENLELYGLVLGLQKLVGKLQKDAEVMSKVVVMLTMESELLRPKPKEKAPEAVKPAEPFKYRYTYDPNWAANNPP